MLTNAHVGEGGVKKGRKCAQVINVWPHWNQIDKKKMEYFYNARIDGRFQTVGYTYQDYPKSGGTFAVWLITKID